MQQLRKTYTDDVVPVSIDAETRLQSTGNSTAGNSFDELYIALRVKENRIATNHELLLLPDVAPDHIHAKEWQIRKRSCQRLIRYIRQKRAPLRILEVGCGNGWLSHRMSAIEGSEVTGLDLNTTELEQARQVFGQRANLRFIQGDLRDGILSNYKYDLIVFAASVQYFPSLTGIINVAKMHLKPHGEIIITDSMFYNEHLVAAAKARSATYFKDLGFPEMNSSYFHHSITDLAGEEHQFLYKPGKLLNRILRKNDPFYSVVIRPRSGV